MGASDKLQKLWQKEYDAEVKLIAGKEKAAKLAIENEAKAAEKSHKIKMDFLEKEYKEKLKVINLETEKVVSELQNQIDAIDEKTKNEQRLEKETRDNEALLALQSKIAAETNADKRKELQVELTQFIAERAREKVLEERDLEKVLLMQKIEEEKTAAANKKSALDVELEEKRANETNKYDATKESLDLQRIALDEFAVDYKTKLDDELKKKQETEAAKLKAAVEAIKGEQLAKENAAENEKKKNDLIAKNRIEIENYKNLDNQWDALYAKFMKGDTMAGLDLISIDSKLKKEKERLHELKVPGFAGGVVNWRGGLARVNEQGGEIRYLDKGTTVIPNDISKKIAESIGGALGGAGGTSTVFVNVIVDGKIIAKAIAPYQQQAARSRSRGQGVI